MESLLAACRPGCVLTPEPLSSPGVGKTALAARLVEIAMTNSATPAERLHLRIHAAHFCRQQDGDSLDPIQVVEAIGRQFCASIPGYLEELAHHADGLHRTISIEQTVAGSVYSGVVVQGIGQLSLGGGDPRRAWAKAVIKPLQRLHDRGDLCEPVVILIDGLDESVEGTVSYNLARLLRAEREGIPHYLRLIITTRPGIATDKIEAHARGTVLDLIADQLPENDDIFTYIKQELCHFSGMGGSRLARRIADASQGNFLYAYFVTRSVQNIVGFPEDVSELPLPSGLTEVYRDFLVRRIASDESAWRSAYRKVLGAIAQSRGDGLSPDQLVVITGGHRHLTSSLTVEDVLRDCAPYLRGSRPNGPFQLYHESLRDYLCRPGEHQIDQEYHSRAILSTLVSTNLDWAASKDDYSFAHLLDHIVDVPFDEQVKGITDSVVGNPGFINGAAERSGIRRLLRQLTTLRNVVGRSSEVIEPVYRIVARQAHHLADWRPRTQPGLLLMQFAYEANRIAAKDLAKRFNDHADQLGIPGLRTRWMLPGYRSRALLHTMRHTRLRASSVAITADGTRGVSANDRDRNIQLWDLLEGNLLRSLVTLHEVIDTLAVDRSGKVVLSASAILVVNSSVMRRGRVRGVPGGWCGAGLAGCRSSRRAGGGG